MLLRAVDLGLNGLMIGAFNKAVLKQEFALEMEPLLILAIGKGTEEIRLTTIPEGESHAYYRENGVHFVPKVRVDDLILP